MLALIANGTLGASAGPLNRSQISGGGWGDVERSRR